MANKKRILLFLCILVFGNAFGQTVRKYSNEFLKIGVGGKYLGLGGSLASADNDVACVFYNPAAIADMTETQVGAMHTSYFAGIANFDYAGVVIPLKNEQALGISLLRFGIDNIPNTLDLYNPDNTINYDKVSSFSIADYALFLSYGRKIPNIDGLSVGGNAKIIHRTYGSFADAWGFGIDLATQIKRERWHAGIYIQDVTTSFNAWTFSLTDAQKQTFANTGNTIPDNSLEITLPAINLGGSYHFLLANDNIDIAPSFKITGYADKRNVLVAASPMSLDAAVGLETGFWKTAYLRMGVYNFTKAIDNLGNEYLSFSPSVGVGLHISNFQINYSYNNVANAGIGLYSHVVSLSYAFKRE